MIFADVNVILYSVKTKTERETIINRDIALLDNWLRMNVLAIKIKNKMDIDMNMVIGDQTLSRTTLTMYLELVTEEGLNGVDVSIKSGVKEQQQKER